MLNKILNFFKLLAAPYQGSSDTFIRTSESIKQEFARANPNLPKIMSLITILESLMVTQGDEEIIKKHQAQFRACLDNYYI